MTQENKFPVEDLSQEQSSAIDTVKTQSMQKQNMKNNGLWGTLISLVFFTIVFWALSTLSNWNSTCVGTLSILYIILIVAIIFAPNQSNKLIEKSAAEENALNEVREQYRVIKQQVSISEKAKVITYLKASAKSPIRLANGDHQMYIWKFEDTIHFFPCIPETVRSISIADLGIKEIPISQIEYFSKQGEIFRESKISGGGGGGSSIGGAVAGGLIAGEAGAIIGSRKKVNEIKSELITHDTRETFLNYFDNDERHSLFFNADAHQIFTDLMPEKEFNIVSALKSSEIIKNQINSDSKKSVTDQLRELAKLRDDGIITENEFNEKKKQLLDKIS